MERVSPLTGPNPFYRTPKEKPVEDDKVEEQKDAPKKD